MSFDANPTTQQLRAGKNPQSIHSKKQAHYGACNDEITNGFAQPAIAKRDRTQQLPMPQRENYATQVGRHRRPKTRFVCAATRQHPKRVGVRVGADCSTRSPRSTHRSRADTVQRRWTLAKRRTHNIRTYEEFVMGIRQFQKIKWKRRWLLFNF